MSDKWSLLKFVLEQDKKVVDNLDTMYVFELLNKDSLAKIGRSKIGIIISTFILLGIDHSSI